jgi:hypothetical protein
MRSGIDRRWPFRCPGGPHDLPGRPVTPMDDHLGDPAGRQGALVGNRRLWRQVLAGWPRGGALP